jgi:hypothetical protein
VPDHAAVIWTSRWRSGAMAGVGRRIMAAFAKNQIFDSAATFASLLSPIAGLIQAPSGNGCTNALWH